MTGEEALKDYEKWLENLHHPVSEIKRSVDQFDYVKRFSKKDKVVRYHYKVEWLQGIYRSFRRFKEDEKEEMERFWSHLMDLAKKNKAKVEDLL